MELCATVRPSSILAVVSRCFKGVSARGTGSQTFLSWCRALRCSRPATGRKKGRVLEGVSAVRITSGNREYGRTGRLPRGSRFAADAFPLVGIDAENGEAGGTGKLTERAARAPPRHSRGISGGNSPVHRSTVLFFRPLSPDGDLLPDLGDRYSFGVDLHKHEGTASAAPLPRHRTLRYLFFGRINSHLGAKQTNSTLQPHFLPVSCNKDNHGNDPYRASRENSSEKLLISPLFTIPWLMIHYSNDRSAVRSSSQRDHLAPIGFRIPAYRATTSRGIHEHTDFPHHPFYPRREIVL